MADRMPELAHHLGQLEAAERDLAGALRSVAGAHAAGLDIVHTSRRLAAECDAHARRLAPFAERYGAPAPAPPDPLYAALFHGPREGGLGLLRDLHDLCLAAVHCEIAWMLVGQAAQGLRDADLHAVVEACAAETEGQVRWLLTRMKAAAPQALVVA